MAARRTSKTKPPPVDKVSPLLARYAQGERAEVWEELIALKARAVSKTARDDTLAVAVETMRRLRVNLEVLEERLRAEGYEFRAATPIAPPTGEAADALAQLAEVAGAIPPSVYALYSVFGSVDFTGYHPELAPRGETLTDPLVILPVESALDDLEDWGAEQDGDGKPEPFQLPISPDGYTKSGFSGGGPYTLPIPTKAADAKLFDAPRPGLTLVQYLQLSVDYAGFPGLAIITPPSSKLLTKLISKLTHGLLPILRSGADPDSSPLQVRLASVVARREEGRRCRSLEEAAAAPLEVTHLNLSRSAKLTIVPDLVLTMTNLVELDVSNTQIAELPPWIGELHKLRSLKVGQNLKMTTLPEELARCTQLRVLDIAISSIDKLPSRIGDLSELRILRARRTNVATLPEDLGRCTKLETLDVSYSGLRALPESVGDLKALVYLHAERNKLTALPSTLGQLSRLRELHLKQNLLPRFPVALCALASLTSLDLSENVLMDLPDEIAALRSLLTLSLRKNKLTELPSTFGRLAMLKKLDLGFNSIRRLPQGFAALQALQWLDLYDNKVTQLPADFVALRGLQVLNLYGNGLTSLPADLGALSALQELDVRGNPIGTLPTSIGLLSRLRSLQATNCDLRSLPKELADIEGLRTLYVDRNQLCELPKQLGQLKKIESFSFGGNPLTDVPDELMQMRATIWIACGPDSKIPPTRRAELLALLPADMQSKLWFGRD